MHTVFSMVLDTWLGYINYMTVSFITKLQTPQQILFVYFDFDD